MHTMAKSKRNVMKITWERNALSDIVEVYR